MTRARREMATNVNGQTYKKQINVMVARTQP